MIHPALALQSEIHSQLQASASLIALLGGQQIFDAVPPEIKPPYVTYGEASHFAWTTGTEDGLEHSIAIEVWSDKAGRKQALEIAEQVEITLATLSPALQDHVLVNLTHEATEVGHDVDAGLFLATLRYRAVTEPQI